LLADILGGGAGARLYKSLVLDRGLALSAGAAYSAGALDLSSFGIWAMPKGDVPVSDLEAAVEAELQRLTRDGIGPDEVRRAAERMQSASVYAQDSLSGPANIIGAGLAIGQSLDEIQSWPERIGAVVPAAIDAAARSIFVERNSTTAVLLPVRGS
jgi:zinc protease